MDHCCFRRLCVRSNLCRLLLRTKRFLFNFWIISKNYRKFSMYSHFPQLQQGSNFCCRLQGMFLQSFNSCSHYIWCDNPFHEIYFHEIKNEKLKLLFPQLQGSNLCRLLLQTAHKKPHLAHRAAKTWTCRNLFSLMSPWERCCFLRRYAKKLIWSRLGCGLCRSTPFVILILIRTLEVYKQTYQGEERQSLFFTFQKCPVSHLRFVRGLLFLKYSPSSPKLNVYNTLATPGKR